MDTEPHRLLFMIRRGKSPLLCQQAWDEPQKIITKVLTHLHYDSLVSPDDAYNSPECRFMAVQRWDTVVYLVCDLFNYDYKFEEAHLEGKNELPVRKVYVSQSAEEESQSIVVRARRKKTIPRVGYHLRRTHDLYGWDVGPPFAIDNCKGAYPTYWNPRSVVTMDAKPEPTEEKGPDT